MPLLMELAAVVRSKNAGAYEITFDIIFDDADLFQAVKRSGILNRELFAKLYHVPAENVFFTVYDAAYAFKGTLPRRTSSGDAADSDVYGAQQHAPLLTVDIPLGAD